jgi:hypothetical protein
MAGPWGRFKGIRFSFRLDQVLVALFESSLRSLRTSASSALFQVVRIFNAEDTEVRRDRREELALFSTGKNTCGT